MNKNYLFILFLMAAGMVTKHASAQEQKNTENNRHAAELGFVENRGQIYDQNNRPNDAVKFLLNMNGLNVQLLSNGFSYDVWQADEVEAETHDPARRLAGEKRPKNLNLRIHRVDVVFEGGRQVSDAEVSESDNINLRYHTVGTPEGGVTANSFRKVV